jgi:hypothetical protein
MKKLLIAILILLTFAANAVTRYVSTTGTNSGAGGIGSPWLTLSYACANSSNGDIIHINAGTFVETSQCVLPVGVSIEGTDSTSTIIRSTLTALYTPIILLSSTQGTNGNQHVSNLRMEGQMTTTWALFVSGRSNVKLFNLSINDFFDRGIIITGAYNTALTTYATGNELYNSSITNCATNNGTGYGCLMIGGQDGLLVHHNTITQQGRPDGQNGWPIKYMDEGHYKNMKIYNNNFNKNPQSGAMNYVDWPFVTELFNLEGGNEIYNNTCIGGGIDLVFMHKGASTYSVWVHDNDIKMLTPNTAAMQNGVTCENEVPAYAPDLPITIEIKDVIVERNIFTNLTNSVYFTPRNGTIVDNIIIRNNLMINASGLTMSGSVVNLGENGGNITYSNASIINNTAIINPAQPMYIGISLPSAWTSGSITNIDIKNNTISGSNAASVLCQNNTIPISNLNISNNNFYNNNVDIDLRSGQSTPGYVAANNIHITPTFGSNYTLLLGSPLIDAGINVGIAYSGSAPDIGYAEYIVGGNVAPSANAGADRTITLPKDSVHITGSGSDVDGTITGYLWTKISGPNTPTLVGTATTNLTITGMIEGTYVYQLRVTDDSATNNTGIDQMTIIVQPIAGNAPPVANAGSDYSLTYSTNAKIITGSATDADGTVVSYAWHKLSGGAYTSLDSTSAIFKPENMSVGTYQFQLIATDDLGSLGKDTMQVIIAAHTGGVDAYAGIDKTINTSSTTLYGAASGGAASSNFNTLNPADKSSNIILSNGNLRMTSTAATDRSGVRGTLGVSSGKWVWKVVCTTIGSGAIGVGNSSASLTNSGSFMFDTNGWGYIPGAGFKSHNGVYTGTSSTGEGNGATILVYLDMTNGASNAGTLRVVIDGNDLGILYSDIGGTVYPISSSMNDATSVFDFDFGQTTWTHDAGYTEGPFTAGSGGSTVSALQWTKLTGGGASITTATTAVTNITGLSTGTYTFELRATDNLANVARDTMTLTVNSGNISPTANAGIDTTIVLPVTSLTVTGSGSDADGTIVSKVWTQTSGTTATITNGTTYSPTFSNMLTTGIRVFRLTVTDNEGATGYDERTVTVNPTPTISTRRRYKLFRRRG